MDSGLQSSCVHCPCPWVESFEFSVPFPALVSYLPFLVGLQFVLKTGNTHSIHLGVEERPRRRVESPRQVLTLGAKRSDCLEETCSHGCILRQMCLGEGKPREVFLRPSLDSYGEVATPLLTVFQTHPDLVPLLADFLVGGGGTLWSNLGLPFCDYMVGGPPFLPWIF